MRGFVVANILDSYEIGQRFTMWPLHVTVLPPFEASDLESVINLLSPIVAEAEPVVAQLGEFAKYGRKNIAQKLIPNPELHALHTKLLQAAEKQGWEVAGRYTGKYYTPHITRKGGRDYEGTEFKINELIVAEALPMGYRRIAAVLPLKGKSGTVTS